LLSFTFIFFSESSLFNGLRVKKIKKALLRAGSRGRLWANVSNSHAFLVFPPVFRRAGNGFRQGEDMATASDFVKEIPALVALGVGD
jgi:hypothetical protein